MKEREVESKCGRIQGCGGRKRTGCILGGSGDEWGDHGVSVFFKYFRSCFSKDGRPQEDVKLTLVRD